MSSVGSGKNWWLTTRSTYPILYGMFKELSNLPNNGGDNVNADTSTKTCPLLLGIKNQINYRETYESFGAKYLNYNSVKHKPQTNYAQKG